jgi:hypothetical protein
MRAVEAYHIAALALVVGQGLPGQRMIAVADAQKPPKLIMAYSVCPERLSIITS